MKSLHILIILLLISCKKPAEVNPCFLVEWEKVTTYRIEAGEKHYETQGLPQVERGADVYCDLSERSIQDLLNALMVHSDSAGVCIKIHAVYRKTSNKK